jgi:fructose-1,6-bisphosphatase I
MTHSNPITVAQYILDQERIRHPNASGDFSWLLCGITLSAKIIAAQVRRAGLGNILGAAGDTNVHGEAQQKLDVFANQALLHALGNRGNVGVLASEENDQPVVVLENPDHGEYIVVFDPLDGSSNIDLNVGVGTIFSIFRRDPSNRSDPATDVLQQGSKQVAAGYILYGSSTMMVYTTGHGVHGFTLDLSIGAFVLSHPDMKMPRRGNLYSVNEANADGFPEGYRRFLHWLKSADDGTVYSSRYIGSLVADFHRTLIKGGVFLYPPTSHYPEGKLRLLYEANPIAMLAEQAGGIATDGQQRIMDIVPENLHQRTPLVVGSKFEMDRLHSFVRAKAGARG